MSKTPQILAGSGLAAVLVTLGPYLVQMYQAHLNNRREMASIEMAFQQSREEAAKRKDCIEPPEGSGKQPGFWWRGDCYAFDPRPMVLEAEDQEAAEGDGVESP